MIEQVKVRVTVTEEVECFQDCWDSRSESHYTKDWDEEQENHYDIMVMMDDDGNILDSKEELESKVKDVAQGKVIDFEIDG